MSWVLTDPDDVQSKDVADPAEVFWLLDALDDDQANGGGTAVVLESGPYCLTVALSPDGVMLFWSDDVEFYSSVGDLPGARGTVWFSYGGSATEVDARRAVRRNVAVLAVAQFMRDACKLPAVDDLAWELE
ncbi:MAG: hypothetical protein LBC97_08590 [Bifidobacteriaceae bacterium]|jgi:hypothetical protein|nr:hypothetical protein [Bifidobacteriaceae bacterium]